jgi:UDPglucose 6-dehydrogenase
MRVAVIGTGYVGLVVGACLAETGNDVICADVDANKIADLNRDKIPIYEPGLEPLVAGNRAAGRLAFSTDVSAAVEASDVVFIAVGTPPDEDGSADLQHVVAVAELIGDHMNSAKVVITKSTVPVGTAAKVRETIAARTSQRFHVCSNPEFLKEGAAVEDFMKPDRVVIGVDSPEAEEVLRQLFAPFVRTGNPIIFMDIASAELTKYAANAMLATRISFMNQMAELCEEVGADITLVRRGIGSDARIGSAFLFPGPGYGGSCFPKDVRALIGTAGDRNVSLDILKAVEAVNDRQKHKLGEKLTAAMGGTVAGKKVAVWGLAFKARTPEALGSARRLFGARIAYADHMYDALAGADALVIVTEWMEYRNPNFGRMKELMQRPLVVDGRNLYDPRKMADLGFTYYGLGRGAA